jgi:class 3 adenylate cyclase
VERRETRYAWNGDTAIAYQVLGDAPTDLIYLQGYSSHVDIGWESPYLSRFLTGLSRRVRLVIMDRRGWGCSERFSPRDLADVDQMADDIAAVMDAIGTQRAAIMASFECTIVASLFAATYPMRTAALILIDPFVTYVATDETPWMPSMSEWLETIAGVRDTWGRSAWLGQTDHGSVATRSSLWADSQEADWFLRYTRASMTPSSLAAELRRYLDVDIRAILPTIQVPTLVFADLDGEFEVKPETGRLVAELIPGAELIEQHGAGGLHRVHWYARGDGIIREVGRFIARLKEEEATFDRVLATIVFTDIVDSTAHAARLGDRGWRDLLARHHAVVRSLLARYRGLEVDTAGDGFLMTFDGPARAVRCALRIVEAVRALGLEVRSGVHTGEVEILDGKPTGTAVNVGARVAAHAQPSEVLVSATVRDLVAGSGISFVDRGEPLLKGLPDRWHLYQAAEAAMPPGDAAS